MGGIDVGLLISKGNCRASGIYQDGRVQILCEEGRIQGAFKLSNVWVIPKDAKKPADRRKLKKTAR